MLVYTRAALLRLLQIDFVRFCIVGGLGFVVNLSLLLLLQRIARWPVFAAQLLAAEVALFCNFTLHHHWTYKRHHVKKGVGILLVQFHATSWPAILGSAIMVSVGETVLHLPSAVALVVASAIALGWNFGWSKYVVWKDDRTPAEIREIATRP